MNITDVRVRLCKNDDGVLKAVASITIDDCFVVHDIKVLSGDNGPYIRMPSKKVPDVAQGKDVYKDIAHPIKTEVREMLNKLVIEAYNKELSKAE